MPKRSCTADCLDCFIHQVLQTSEHDRAAHTIFSRRVVEDRRVARELSRRQLVHYDIIVVNVRSWRVITRVRLSGRCRAGLARSARWRGIHTCKHTCEAQTPTECPSGKAHPADSNGWLARRHSITITITTASRVLACWPGGRPTQAS